MSLNDKDQPRGIRNNNPGNIRKGNSNWIGLADDQSSDSAFVIFKHPAYGIRAIARILSTYQKKYHLESIKEIIDRWAPPIENDTSSYCSHVAKQLCLSPNTKIILNRELMSKLVTAIILHENGQNPYDQLTIRAGVLAHFEPKYIDLID